MDFFFFSSYIKKCIQHHLRVNHTRKKHVKHSLLFFCWIFFPILCAKNVNELFAPSASLTQFQKKKKTNQKFPSRKRYTSKWRQPSIFHSFFYQIKSLKILFTLGIYLSLLLLFKLSAAAAARRPLYWPSWSLWLCRREPCSGACRWGRCVRKSGKFESATWAERSAKSRTRAACKPNGTVDWRTRRWTGW